MFEFGSIILEFLGALFKWIVQFFIIPFTRESYIPFLKILNGNKKASGLEGLYFKFSNSFAGFFVLFIFVMAILCWPKK